MKFKFEKLIGKGILKIGNSSQRIMILVVVFLVVAGMGTLLWSKFGTKPVSAAWYDDSWIYRRVIPIATHTAAESNVYITFQLDTASLIAASKLQSACQDIRVTDSSGNLLKYHVGRTNACNNAATTIDALVPTMPAGAQDYYVYYGNSRAVSADAGLFSQSICGNSCTTNPTLGSEEKGVGPIAYWQFDEGQGTTVNDSTANHNPGTTTATTWEPSDLCVSGQCLFFNGSSSLVDTPSQTLGGAFTLTAWVKKNSSGAMAVIGQGSSDTSQMSFYLRPGGKSGFGTSLGVYQEFNTPDVSSNSWHMVTLVYTGSALNYYVDGAVSASTGASGTPMALSNHTFIGRLGDYTGGQFFSGFIDEPKIYNYARSSAQIQADYNSKGAALFHGASGVLGAQTNDALNNGLVGYWRMDDNVSGNSKTLTDASGNGNSATTNNGANASGMDCSIPGKFGFGCHFDATDDFVNVTNTLSGVQTVAFWASPSATTLNILDLNGTNTITMSSGVISANSFSGTTLIYVNGVPSNGTLTANVWNHVVITTTSGITASAITLGKVGSNFYGGRLDEVRMYKRLLSGAEAQQLYNFGPGPVAYWNFEEGQGSTINDRSTNGRTGSWNGSGGHWTSGKVGKAVKFNGTDDYINVPSSTGIKGGSGSMTFETWYMRTGSTGTVQTLLGKMFTNSDQATYFWYVSDAGKLTFQTTNGSVNGAQVFDSTSSPVSSNNVWYHLAVEYTWGNASSAVFYVNGVPYVGTWTVGTGNTTFTDNSLDLYLGRIQHNSNFWLKGQLDEVLIYNYPRTQKQIIQDMNGGHPAGGSPIGSAVDWWTFDEGQGTVANDDGYGRNAGTLTNMAAVASVGTSGWNPHGRFGKAVSFDGVNDFVDFGDMSTFENISTMSASLWVNPNSVAQKICLLCKFQQASAANKESFGIETGVTNGNAVLVELSTDGNTATASGETPAGVLTVGKWTHILAVYDGGQVGNANRLRIYINGVPQTLVFTGTIPSATWSTTSNLRAGASSDATPARLFSGSMDEIKLYSSALTQSEVLIDYNKSQSTSFGVLGTSTSDGKTASNSAATAYCVPGDTTSCGSPVGEWNFDEGTGTVAFDYSGNNNSGNWNGTTPFWTIGMVGKAGKFNGIDDYVQTTSANGLDLSTNFTLQAWIKTSVSNDGNFHLIVGKYSENTSNGSYKLYLNQTGQIGFYNGVVGEFAASGSTTIPVNQWVHVAATFNGSKAKVFINGRLDTSANYSTSFGNVADNIRIGFNSTGVPQRFLGSIDQVRIYNYARTSAQIAYDYNRGKPQTWWDFDECQGSVAHDFVGSVSGTINGGTVGSCNTGSTAWADGKTGKFNYALAFGSAPDVTTVTSTNTYPFSPIVSTNASWGAWINPTSSINNQAIIDKQNQFRVYTDSSGNAVCGIYYGGAYHDSANVTAPVALNAWNHVICTYDGTNIKTYVNGLLRNITADGNGIAVATTNLYVGQLSDASKQLTGKIDDVKIWNYPLTQVLIRNELNQNSAIRFGPSQGAP